MNRISVRTAASGSNRIKAPGKLWRPARFAAKNSMPGTVPVRGAERRWNGEGPRPRRIQLQPINGRRNPVVSPRSESASSFGSACCSSGPAMPLPGFKKCFRRRHELLPQLRNPRSRGRTILRKLRFAPGCRQCSRSTESGSVGSVRQAQCVFLFRSFPEKRLLDADSRRGRILRLCDLVGAVLVRTGRRSLGRLLRSCGRFRHSPADLGICRPSAALPRPRLDRLVPLA